MSYTAGHPFFEMSCSFTYLGVPNHKNLAKSLCLARLCWWWWRHAACIPLGTDSVRAVVRLSLWFHAQLAAWSSGMFPAQGARGPGFNSQSSPVSVPPVFGAQHFHVRSDYFPCLSCLRSHFGCLIRGPVLKRQRLCRSVTPAKIHGNRSQRITTSLFTTSGSGFDLRETIRQRCPLVRHDHSFQGLTKCDTDTRQNMHAKVPSRAS